MANAEKMVILAAGAGSRIAGLRDLPKPLIPILGIPLVERGIVGARRAGFEDFVIVVGNRADEIRRTLGDGARLGVRIEYVQNDEWRKSNGVSLLKASHRLGDPFCLMMSDHIFDPAAFRHLARTRLGTDGVALLTDRDVPGVFDLDDATKVATDGDRIVGIGKAIANYDCVDTGLFKCSRRFLDAIETVYRAKGDASLSDGMQAMSDRRQARAEDVTGVWWQDVDAPAAYRHGEKLLMRSLVKPTDVWVSRKLNRPISMFFSRRLAPFRVRPHVVSLLSALPGVLSFFCLIRGDAIGFVLGGLCFHLASVMDGCDGEIARLKHQESKAGEWIDTICDAVSYVCFAAGLTLGLYAWSANTAYLWLGGFTFAAVLALLGVMAKFLLANTDRGTLIAVDQRLNDDLDRTPGFGARAVTALKPLMKRANFSLLLFVLCAVGLAPAVLGLVCAGVVTTIAVLLAKLSPAEPSAAAPGRPKVA